MKMNKLTYYERNHSAQKMCQSMAVDILIGSRKERNQQDPPLLKTDSIQSVRRVTSL